MSDQNTQNTQSLDQDVDQVKADVHADRVEVAEQVTQVDATQRGANTLAEKLVEVTPEIEQDLKTDDAELMAQRHDFDAVAQAANDDLRQLPSRLKLGWSMLRGYFSKLEHQSALRERLNDPAQHVPNVQPTDPYADTSNIEVTETNAAADAKAEAETSKTSMTLDPATLSAQRSNAERNAENEGDAGVVA